MLLFKEKMHTSSLYATEQGYWRNTQKQTESKKRKCLTISDLVRRTLPLTGIWCCYLMTKPDFSTFNVGDERCIGLLGVGGTRSSPGGCQATGCSPMSRGQSRKVGEHRRSLSHLVCPNWCWALHKCCARFIDKLEQDQNFSCNPSPSAIFEFVSDRSLDMANAFSSCGL